jgi:hypothetical protein
MDTPSLARQLIGELLDQPKKTALKEANYSPVVDKHIYVGEGGATTPGEWVEVVLAALDQAGFSPQQVGRVSDCIDRELGAY